MRLPSSVALVVRVAILVAATGVSACAKSPPEAHSAPAASAPPPGSTGDKGDKKAEPPSDTSDSTPPPGVDVSKLDELARKIFFRVVTSEPSVCGKAQSLLASAKKDESCRRSLNAVKYVARLADQGYTQSEISEALEQLT